MKSRNNEPPRSRSGGPGTPSPGLLEPIPRAQGRARLGVGDPPPFSGVDLWNGYELSWLSASGRPVAATAEFRFPATSPNIIESKSLKLYLNAFNERRHASAEAVRTILRADLGRVSGADVEVRVRDAAVAAARAPGDLPGHCIDTVDVRIAGYDYDPALLSGSAAGAPVDETLHSHLFKSNCPVTGQPDWASVLVRYRGARIRRDRLLAYLVSYRHHAEYHEQCVERIFMDIHRHCRPEALSVYARYTRRGGLDINPFRTDFEGAPENLRTARQ